MEYIELRKEDVTSEKWNDILHKLGIADVGQQQRVRVDLVHLYVHQQALAENIEHKATIKDMKSNIRATMAEMTSAVAFYETYLG